MSDGPLVWLITGSSSGFGKYIALEAFKREHDVISTARNASRLSGLKTAGAVTLSLDVTAPLSELKNIVKEAQSQYGRITHLVNAAGYVLERAVEEIR